MGDPDPAIPVPAPSIPTDLSGVISATEAPTVEVPATDVSTTVNIPANIPIVFATDVPVPINARTDATISPTVTPETFDIIAATASANSVHDTVMISRIGIISIAMTSILLWSS